MNKLDYRIASDRGVLVKFGQEVNEETLQRLLSFKEDLENSDIPGIVETNWGFCDLLILYDPSKIDYETLNHHLRKIEQEVSNDKIDKILYHSSKIIEIPVVYGGEYGPDLPLVVEILNVSEEEIIQSHLSNCYLIYFTGFIGGTAHFKANDKLFDLPRKKTPVISYPAGSVTFADGKGCAFKAADGPTGWYSIGRSPLRQWFPYKDPPVLIQTGDRIRFRRIDEDEFHKIKREVDQNTYKLKYL